MPMLHYTKYLIKLISYHTDTIGVLGYFALPLCLIQLGTLLHQEDARARFLYKVSNLLVTRVVGMLCELLNHHSVMAMP